MSDQTNSREMTPAERRLAIWMLEHGNDQAQTFLPQIDRVRITPWRCPCGCASVNFIQGGQAEPTGDMRVLGDFVFGQDETLNGIFIFEIGGHLSGIDVYGLGGNASPTLPRPEECRPEFDELSKPNP